MFKNSKRNTYSGGVRLTALLLVVLAVFGFASCDRGNTPSDTTDKTVNTTVPPVTDEPVPEEVKLVNTVFTSKLLQGDIPGPFADTGKTVYITMGIPEGLGGGYREFAAQSDAAAQKSGFSLISAEDLISFNSKYLAVQTTESTLSSLRPELAAEGFTLMDSEKLTLEDGRVLSVFYTFTKEGNGGRYEAYCYLLAADGLSVFPFVCNFEGFTAFRDTAVRERVKEMAATVTVHDDDYTVKLSEGLESRSFSLYDNLPEGYTVLQVKPYVDEYIAVFAKDKAKTLYVRFFNYKTNELAGSWNKISDKAETCEVFAAENGLTVSTAYGKYYTVTGSPESIKVQLITRTFSDAVYSADGSYRAYIQAAGGNVIVEELARGTTTVAYSPRTESVDAHEELSARLVCFSRDNSLIFEINGKDRTVGYGIFNAATNAVSVYENGLSPIGCTASTVWLMRYEGEKPVEILRAELTSPDKTESMYLKDGARKQGFFDNYEDIFFESKITLNRGGTHFVLFPADDASRISVFSAQTFECIYTTPVPHISEVISLEKQIIVGTQGWGTLYTLDLPEKKTPGGSFDHESVVEEPNYAPEYREVMELIGYSAPYLYRPAKGAVSFSSTNLIYFLLNYAAENGLGEEYIEYVEVKIPIEETEALTDVTEAVTDTDTASDTVAEVIDEVTATDDVTTEAEEPKYEIEIVEVPKYRVQIYTLKKLAWELLGITEDYFGEYITELAPKLPEEEIPEDAVTGEPEGEEEREPEEEKPENAYIGLEGDDRYDRDTGYFYYTPESNTPSGWKVETGGTLITHTSNTLTVKTVLVAPDGTRMNAEYSVEAVNSYYRITAVTVSVSLNVVENIPYFELDGTKYSPMWYAVEKGSNRVYYPLVEVQSATPITAVLRDDKGYGYRENELVFGEVRVYGTRAVIAVSRYGIYEMLVIDMQTGKSSFVSGKNGFNDYASVISEMQKAGKSYAYYGARFLGSNANGSRVLYLVSDGVNKLGARYYIYDLATGGIEELSGSLSGTGATISKTEYFQWISSSRVRISVWETVNLSFRNNVYEWVYTGGEWRGVKTDYSTNGTVWNGTGGSEIIETDAPDDTREITDDEFASWSDESGWGGGGITLRELAELYYEARAEEIAKRENYTFNGVSEYVITFRSNGYIVMTERCVLYNSEGKPAGITKNIQNICQIVNGEWKWVRITLP